MNKHHKSNVEQKNEHTTERIANGFINIKFEDKTKVECQN